MWIPCLHNKICWRENLLEKVRLGHRFRGADAAQICNNVSLVADDGVFECSFAIAARRIVGEKW
jgi:hypothetical protein